MRRAKDPMDPKATGKDVKEPRPPLARAIAENIECLAIAIVMALILKFFLLEAYKIPTGSMQPTIIGLDEANVKIFDRVLVNKMIYFLREPERFEVVVFKMPLSQRQNYIKRLLGLPGEKIRIRNGDVFVTPAGESEFEGETVTRKPDEVWDSIRLRAIPASLDEPDYEQTLQSGGDENIVLEALLSHIGINAEELRTLSTARGEDARKAGIHLLVQRTHLQDREIIDLLGLRDSDRKEFSRARSPNPSRKAPEYLDDVKDLLDRDFSVSGDSIELSAGDGSASFHAALPIKDAYYHGYSPKLLTELGVRDFSRDRGNSVSDLEISALLRPSGANRSVTLEIRGTRFVHSATFHRQEGDVEIRSEKRWVPNPSANGADPGVHRFTVDLPSGELTEVRFRNVDDQLVLMVDDEEIARLPYETHDVDPERLRASVVVRCDGGDLELEEFELFRDIFYTSEGGYGPSTVYEVPDDAYFVMGDNTQHSYDCRQWKYGVYTLDDGQEVSGILLREGQTDPDANPRLVGRSVRGERMQFRNFHGELYEFDSRDVQGPVTIPYHYVPEEFLLGKALAVFWPLPPFSPTWRLRLIR